MWLLKYRIDPEQRAALPVGVGAWLPAVAMAMDRAQADADKQDSRGG